MITELIIDEFNLIFTDRESESRFAKMIENAMGMIENARELINDDELMYMIINPIANSIMHAIAIMLDDDDLDAINSGTDQIATIIMDSFAD